jgi:hypothetical protein
MRSIIRIFVLAAALVSTAAAFARDRVGVNVPFSFETRGKICPAGSYEVEYDPDFYALKLSSKTDRKIINIWIAFPADFGPNASELSLRFDHGADGTRVLRSIRFEKWATPLLDIRDKYVAQYEVSSTGSR